MVSDPSADDTLQASPTVTTVSDSGLGLGLDLEHLPTGNARYVVGSLLGKGGMGDVMLAQDAQIGREVAVKRMRSLQVGTVDRFLREARIQGRLDHPAIVPVHEVAVDAAGLPYFVMKRLAGTTLSDILANRGGASLEVSSIDKHPLSRLLRAFTDVCLAVEFAHTRGVIHRDLKPANIMLGDFGEVYVLDWGVARVAGDAKDAFEAAPVTTSPGGTEAGAVLGTIGYMPPEQLRGQPIDRRADVYALGCILFEILAGSPLHTPGELTAVLDEYDARPSVRAPQRDVPPELEALVVRATDPDPARRPSSARELSDRVQRYLDGDRDVALRRKLAREQLSLARAALITERDETTTTASRLRQPPTDAQRRLVMQHAARALALDPTSNEGAELVGRVMLEPPRETPPEIEADLAAADDLNLHDQAKVAFASFLLYLVFVPLMAWVGIRDPLYLTVVGVASVANCVLAYVLSQHERSLPSWFLWLVAAANVILIAILARMFSPLLVAPGLACATALGFSMHPRFGKMWVLACALTIGVLAPWVLERAGVWSRTISDLGGTLSIRSPGGPIIAERFEVVHAMFVFALLFTVATLARRITGTQREARREAHLHAWHLRQLVPVAAPSTNPGRT